MTSPGVNAREIALSVVRDVFPAPGSNARERSAQEALDYRLRRANAPARDRAFATELAYGSIKMRRALDWYLEPFLGERFAALPPAAAEILRLAAYELIFTQADVHATVFEFVNLTKRHAHRGLANLVNAVLRNLLRAAPAPPERASFDDEDEYLGTRYSLPTWIVRRWRAAFGTECEAICAGVNDPARAAIVVNALCGTVEQTRDALDAAGVRVSPSALVRESLLIDGGAGTLAGMDREAAGRWWMQSESSAAPVDVLNPQPGETVLDVCSGRGNKALQIGARLAGEGTLTCIERDPAKVARLLQRLEEAGVAAAAVTADAIADGALPPELNFDRVLVDAPCSGIGVVGRHAEARWKKHAGDGERLAMTQRALLESAARHVRSGGALVYAVCSNDERETRDVIDGFLQHAPFERGLIPAAYAALLTAEGDVAIPPGLDGRDGFYIARLERR